MLKSMYNNEVWIFIDEKVELGLKFELMKLCFPLEKKIFDLYVKNNHRERCVSRTFKYFTLKP